MAAAVVFFVVAFSAFLGALLLVFHRRPMVAALGMALATLSVGALFIALHVPFLGLFQVIVYAGAVMVMVLYIIMALGQEEEGPEVGNAQTVLAYLSALALIFYLFTATRTSALGAFFEPGEGYGTIKTFGDILVSDYAVPFELASLLLVGAMVGAVVLSRRKS